MAFKRRKSYYTCCIRLINAWWNDIHIRSIFFSYNTRYCRSNKLCAMKFSFFTQITISIQIKTNYVTVCNKSKYRITIFDIQTNKILLLFHIYFQTSQYILILVDYIRTEYLYNNLKLYTWHSKSIQIQHKIQPIFFLHGSEIIRFKEEKPKKKFHMDFWL